MPDSVGGGWKNQNNHQAQKSILTVWPLLEPLIIYVFNESLGYIMQEILGNGMGTHNFTDRPFPLRGFVNIDRSLHNTLDIGEIEPVFSITVGAWQAFGFSLKLLVAVCKREGFGWHKIRLGNKLQNECRS